MRAEVGDQLVGPGLALGFGELLGFVTEVHGEDGGPPYMIRWHSDGHESLVRPDPERYWIRSHRTTHEVRMTDDVLHRVGSAADRRASGQRDSTG